MYKTFHIYPSYAAAGNLVAGQQLQGWLSLSTPQNHSLVCLLGRKRASLGLLPTSTSSATCLRVSAICYVVYITLTLLPLSLEMYA